MRKIMLLMSLVCLTAMAAGCEENGMVVLMCDGGVCLSSDNNNNSPADPAPGSEQNDPVNPGDEPKEPDPGPGTQEPDSGTQDPGQPGKNDQNDPTNPSDPGQGDNPGPVGPKNPEETDDPADPPSPGENPGTGDDTPIDSQECSGEEIQCTHGNKYKKCVKGAWDNEVHQCVGELICVNNKCVVDENSCKQGEWKCIDGVVYKCVDKQRVAVENRCSIKGEKSGYYECDGERLKFAECTNEYCAFGVQTKTHYCIDSVAIEGSECANVNETSCSNDGGKILKCEVGNWQSLEDCRENGKQCVIKRTVDIIKAENVFACE